MVIAALNDEVLGGEGKVQLAARLSSDSSLFKVEDGAAKAGAMRARMVNVAKWNILIVVI
jgi:hypothetical protein